MLSILVIGKNGYIGEHIKHWLDKYPEKYSTEIVSSMDGEWKNTDFSKFSVVVNTAGIAHINNITEDMRDMFFSVNRDLAIELASHSKKAGVKQFILFSSMNVYGDRGGTVTNRDATNPTSFYGQSKFEGDMGALALKDGYFKVASIRPPFVYGKGCKGNYNTISHIARKTPIFPDFKNKKSMIYIDNLCEFVRLLIDDGSGGIYTPQNRELVSTTELVRTVAKCHNHKIWFTKLFNWGIYPTRKILKDISRAFADDCYDLSVSKYWNFEYCVVDFKESIKRTEKR